MVAVASSSRQKLDSPPLEGEYALPKDYKPYVPVAKRRAALLNTLGRHQAKRVKTVEDEEDEEEDDGVRAELELEKAREKARRERTLLQAAQEVKERKAMEG